SARARRAAKPVRSGPCGGACLGFEVQPVPFRKVTQFFSRTVTPLHCWTSASIANPGLLSKLTIDRNFEQAGDKQGIRRRRRTGFRPDYWRGALVSSQSKTRAGSHTVRKPVYQWFPASWPDLVPGTGGVPWFPDSPKPGPDHMTQKPLRNGLSTPIG